MPDRGSNGRLSLLLGSSFTLIGDFPRELTNDVNRISRFSITVIDDFKAISYHILKYFFITFFEGISVGAQEIWKLQVS